MNNEINSILKIFTNFNSDYIDNIIEKNLLYVFITDDLNINDKEMIHILIDIQKKTKFREIKYIFIISFLFSIKKIIDNSSSEYEPGRNKFYKQAFLKIITLIVSKFFGNKLSGLFNEEESKVIPDLIDSCSIKFSSQFKNYIFKEFETNYDNDPATIKFAYQNSYHNILNVYKVFVEVCYAYIKIITKCISLYIMPFILKEVSIATYVKTILINIYTIVLFHNTYKKCKVNISTNTNTSSDHIEDFFNNLYKMIEKNTLPDEIELLNEIITQDLFSNNGKNKYTLNKLSKERLKQTKIYQMYETLLSIVINQRSILTVTDGFKRLYEDYSYCITQFKIKLKETYFFIDIIKTKNYQLSDEIQWNDDNTYMYTLRNVTLEYTENEITKVILKNVNLDFEYGKAHYIHGSSGCGKSTLLLAFIKRIKINNDGSILFFGLYDFSYFSIRKYITFITSQTTLFKNNLYYNFTYGIDKNVLKTKNDEIMNTIEKYMTCFNLQTLIPYIKVKNANKLSKGQEQRIVIINLILDVIYNNKKILFLDEFTSNIDSVNEKNIFQELKKLQNMYNLTIFYISHNESNIIYSEFNYHISVESQSITKNKTQPLL